MNDEANVTHGASYREFPHFLSCLNSATSQWVNVVYEIARSGELILVSCHNHCSQCVIKLQKMNVIPTMEVVSKPALTPFFRSTVAVKMDIF